MYLLERAARKEGHAVSRPGYPSMRKPPEELVARWVLPALERARADGQPVHVITHSLGGILLRLAMGKDAPDWLGRVVMICPPNQGSEIVDYLIRHRLPRLFIGPTGCLLGTGAESLPRRLPPIPFKCGIIGADRSMDPVLGKLLPRPHDGKVSLISTRCEGVKDYALVHTNHAFSMCHPEAVKLALRFISTGNFDEPGSRAVAKSFPK
jgi:hypothetical protein